MLKIINATVIASSLFLAACGVEQGATLSSDDLVSGKNVFSVTKSKSSELSVEQVKSTIEEIDQFCSSGCKYKAGAVKQQSVLDQRGDEVLSHSVSATPLGDEAAFMLTKVVVEANGNVVVDVRQPKGAELKEIMDQYSDLRHNPTFDLNFRTRYVVQAKENGSLVQLQIAAESSKYNPRTFIVGGMIKGKLEENLDILLSNY